MGYAGMPTEGLQPPGTATALLKDGLPTDTLALRQQAGKRCALCSQIKV